MAIDIFDALESAFGGSVTQQLSTVFGSSEEGTRSGLSSGLSALLAGVLHKSMTPAGADDVYRTVTSDTVDASLPSRVTGLLGDRSNLETLLGTGQTLLSSVFGNRTSGVTQALSEVAGIKPSSATGLLAVAAPILMSLLKKHVAQGNLNAQGLGSMLLGQRDALQGAGLDSRIVSAMGFPSLQGLLGTSGAPEAPRSVSAASASVEPEAYAGPEPRSAAYVRPVENARRGRWIPWAVAAAVAIAMLGFFSTRLGNRERAPMASATALPASVYFDVGRADLTTNSQRTIEAVASSVKSSSAPVAVTGYTDASGDPDRNAELAKNRASAVRDALVREGVAPERVMMASPASIIPGTPPDESRRVDIKLAEVDGSTNTLR